MHTDDTPITSARRAWDSSSPRQRLAMLREAGYAAGGRAYQRFIDLPAEVKVDLNYVATRKAETAVTA